MAAYHRDKATGRTEEEVVSLFEEWLVEHGKLYNTFGEKEKRFQIFKEKLRHIDERNKVLRTYQLGLNQFSDLTNEEFRATYLGGYIDKRNSVNRTFRLGRNRR